MPRIRFVGDPKDDFSGPRNMRMWGHNFVKDDYLEVPDSVAAKARTHSHFQIEGEGEDPHAGPAEGHPTDAMSRQELADLLDVEGVEYPKNGSKAKLAAIAVEHGLPHAFVVE